MSPTLAFILLALLLLVVFAILAVRRTKDVTDLDHALTEIRSLDIQAFRNLVDPEEEEFLRSSLPPPQFKRIKRERARAALAYTTALSRASLQFARFGDAAQRSSDPAIAASGKQIATSAVDLRMRALDARVRLAFTAAFPSLPARPLRPLLEQYDRAAYLMVRHNGLTRQEVRG